MAVFACKCCGTACVFEYRITWDCEDDDWIGPVLVTKLCGTSNGKPLNTWIPEVGKNPCVQVAYIATEQVCTDNTTADTDCDEIPAVEELPPLPTLTDDEKAFCCGLRKCYATFYWKRICATQQQGFEDVNGNITSPANAAYLDECLTDMEVNFPLLNTWVLIEQNGTFCRWKISILNYPNAPCTPGIETCRPPSVGIRPRFGPAGSGGCECCPEGKTCVFKWHASYTKATGQWSPVTPFSRVCRDSTGLSEGWRKTADGDICQYEYTQLSGECCIATEAGDDPDNPPPRPGMCTATPATPTHPNLNETGIDGLPLACSDSCSSCVDGPTTICIALSGTTGGTDDDMFELDQDEGTPRPCYWKIPGNPSSYPNAGCFVDEFGIARWFVNLRGTAPFYSFTKPAAGETSIPLGGGYTPAAGNAPGSITIASGPC